MHGRLYPLDFHDACYFGRCVFEMAAEMHFQYTYKKKEHISTPLVEHRREANRGQSGLLVELIFPFEWSAIKTPLEQVPLLFNKHEVRFRRRWHFMNAASIFDLENIERNLNW